MRIKYTLFGMSDAAWFENPDGDAVPLFIDPNALDAAGVEAAAREYVTRMVGGNYWQMMTQHEQEVTEQAMRAAIAAYARVVGGAP